MTDRAEAIRAFRDIVAGARQMASQFDIDADVVRIPTSAVESLVAALDEAPPRPEDVYTWAEFRSRGFLWLVNASCFHPRGYALAFHWPEGADPDVDDPIGWAILGDGTESWRFDDPPDRPGYLDDLFRAVEVTLAEAADRDRAKARAAAADREKDA